MLYGGPSLPIKKIITKLKKNENKKIEKMTKIFRKKPPRNYHGL